MAEDTPSGETATPGTTQTEVSTGSTPTGNTNDAAREQAQKELEQLKMRNNQLANQLEETRKADEARKAEQLKEKEEFKILYEQTQSKLDALDAQQKADQQRQSLAKATQELLKDYDQNVIDLATTAGLELTEDSDEARKSLTEKLETFKSKVSPGGKVTSNNPSNPAPSTTDRSSLTARAADGSSPMAIAAAKGDDSVTLEYIRSLPAIQRLKEIAAKGN